jgi:hypothetical protein
MGILLDIEKTNDMLDKTCGGLIWATPVPKGDMMGHQSQAFEKGLITGPDAF